MLNLPEKEWERRQASHKISLMNTDNKEKKKNCYTKCKQRILLTNIFKKNELQEICGPSCNQYFKFCLHSRSFFQVSRCVTQLLQRPICLCEWKELTAVDSIKRRTFFSHQRRVLTSAHLWVSNRETMEAVQ